MTQLIFILVSFCASVIGCICGIGGGVIIKPVLDAFGLYSVSTISFMSGCIVLSMTTYSVVKATLAKESVIEKGVSTWLGIGAAVGGLLGKQLFDSVKAMFENADTVGAVQAAALFLVTLGTMLYTVNKQRIATKNVKNTGIFAGSIYCNHISGMFHNANRGSIPLRIVTNGARIGFGVTATDGTFFYFGLYFCQLGGETSKKIRIGFQAKIGQSHSRFFAYSRH